MSVSFRLKLLMIQPEIMNEQSKTHHNRSVYVIGAPHRENFLAKDDR